MESSIYPADWPRCPFCGDFARDGQLTCGNYQCKEAAQREREGTKHTTNGETKDFAT